MLVTAKEMLEKARDGKYAVGHFNINNLEWTKAILQTAEELRSPVILGVSEGAGKYMTGFKTVVGMVNGMLEETEDHCSGSSSLRPWYLRGMLISASMLDSPPSCSTVLTTRSKRTLRRQKN